MKTGVINLGLILAFSFLFTACNKEEFFEKEYLETPTDVVPTDGPDNGAGQGGQSGGTGSTQGGVDSGSGSGGQTGGGSTGSSTGGTDGSTSGGSSGSSTGGTIGGSTGGTYGDCNQGHGNDPDQVDDSNPTIGLDPRCTVEKFRQSAEETKKIDILWVIDNSGSMADEQSSLGTNFSAFIDDFITKNVDFKMAITTTDTSTSERRGRMVAGSDTKLTSAKAKLDESQFKSDFGNLIRVGINGSGNEKGLEASEAFMQKYATGFLRSDAYLAVVFVSDEEDQSTKLVSTYVDFLRSFKTNAGLIKIYSVVDVNDTNCCQAGITTGSERYQLASKNTSGLVADIRDDFHSTLSEMGTTIISLLESFALANRPVPDSLKVYVNGVQSLSYSYDEASNAIKFHANALPPVNAEIKVYYVKK